MDERDNDCQAHRKTPPGFLCSSVLAPFRPGSVFVNARVAGRPTASPLLERMAQGDSVTSVDVSTLSLSSSTLRYETSKTCSFLLISEE